MTYRETNPPPEADRSILVVALSGHIFGVDRATGQIVWRNKLSGGGYGEVFLALRYGLVVASAAGDRVYSLEYATGATRWTATTRGSGRATILIEPDLVVVAKGGYLDAFDHDGNQRWSQPLEGEGHGRIALGFPGNVAQADDPGRE